LIEKQAWTKPYKPPNWQLKKGFTITKAEKVLNNQKCMFKAVFRNSIEDFTKSLFFRVILRDK
jgi:hypothetical protein